ncbi:MAG: sialate O-acetylesterase [Lachnospiraceae bacterium]|nr:sialate O-acetylesterase [Lachnospiraceae bacterium]
MVDLILFMGQSNMAGRGVTCERWPQSAPRAIEGAGYEYRAISAPDCLSPLEEPFGRAENDPDGIDDGKMKTGSLVTSFVNAYYQRTGTSVVGISASKGGSSILQWQPDTPFMRDVERRLDSARNYLEKAHISVRHTVLVWCQGETDGDHRMHGDEYILNFEQFWRHMQSLGVEQCFLIRIGHYNGPEAISYQEIMDAQDQIPQRMDGVIMVSTEFAGMKERGLMKDAFHYYQAAYNEVGRAAGERAGKLICERYGINGQNERKTAEKSWK